MSLTSRDHFLLANLYDSDEWKALFKLMADQQLRIAEENIGAPDMTTVGFNKGRVASLRWLVDSVHAESKRSKRKEKSSVKTK